MQERVARLEEQTRTLYRLVDELKETEAEHHREVKADLARIVALIENGKLTQHRLTSHDTGFVEVHRIHDACRTEVVGRLSSLEQFRANLTGRWAVLAVLAGVAMTVVNGVITAVLVEWVRR